MPGESMEAGEKDEGGGGVGTDDGRGDEFSRGAERSDRDDHAGRKSDRGGDGDGWREELDFYVAGMVWKGRDEHRSGSLGGIAAGFERSMRAAGAEVRGVEQWTTRRFGQHRVGVLPALPALPVGLTSFEEAQIGRFCTYK